ncbi:hypothetical protein SNE25_04600 [Mucilaginibacter sabulilitoris]|uniref:Uncharacterized protein n=1 Tax=Mucilaginibacter sabulilitoris TaxID=1173583 RepID=A0ABZ0TNT9_9SPHI|nr:hypothetical protein [Mucilaginibacter sabulilitoris]WPU94800.1 hypothetical protein SNE25_04600 [Mucilaginibacter sabulilitoris]
MQELLKLKLRDFLAQNRPEILIGLQENNATGDYLDDKISQLNDLPEKLLDDGKPMYEITELCMAALTSDLGPSRLHLIAEILDDDFLPMADMLRLQGLLNYELINLLDACEPVFQELGVDQNNRILRFAIGGAIQEYGQTNWTAKKIMLWLSHPSKN